MKVIIAGSRSITEYSLVKKAVELSGFNITEVVSGGANGIDKLGEKWAEENNIPVKRFIPDWDNVEGCNCVKINQFGKEYNPKAGHDRNKKMAEYGDALVLIWDGVSKGSLNMQDQMKRLGKWSYILKA